MTKATKGQARKHARTRAAGRGMVYVTIGGKRVKSTRWAADVLRLATKALKGVEPPQR